MVRLTHCEYLDTSSNIPGSLASEQSPPEDATPGNIIYTFSHHNHDNKRYLPIRDVWLGLGVKSNPRCTNCTVYCSSSCHTYQ